MIQWVIAFLSTIAIYIKYLMTLFKKLFFTKTKAKAKRNNRHFVKCSEQDCFKNVTQIAFGPKYQYKVTEVVYAYIADLFVDKSSALCSYHVVIESYLILKKHELENGEAL